MEYMNEQHHSHPPFKTLGTHLKYLREQSKESLEEVSGAVEINETTLQRIEAGIERPMEDILLLMISHFGMPDQEAVQLWELAGYEGDLPERIRPENEIQPGSKSIVMLLALDMRTIYTDGLDISCSAAGITMNFSQASGQQHPMPVARLGMSYDQAEKVLLSLQQALLKARYLRGPKALPPQAGETGESRSTDDD
jgi:transcriptional regulator with XRE-family HTH domain